MAEKLFLQKTFLFFIFVQHVVAKRGTRLFNVTQCVQLSRLGGSF